MILKGKALSFIINHHVLNDKIDLSVSAGSFTAIVGPNGAGKTTLLNLLDGDVTPTLGNVVFDGKSLTEIDRLALAQQRAVLPQLGSVPFAIKAFEIVTMGREPYRYQKEQQHNSDVVNHCLQEMDITHLAKQHYNTLSGGERHRVQIARTLAQIYHRLDADLGGKVLFLDEPTNHLDIHHQYRLMKILKNLQQRGLTIIAVMHDLSLTLQYAEHILLLNQGKKVGSYSAQELVDSNDLSTVYKMDMRVRWDRQWQRYILAPKI